MWHQPQPRLATAPQPAKNAGERRARCVSQQGGVHPAGNVLDHGQHRANDFQSSASKPDRVHCAASTRPSRNHLFPPPRTETPIKHADRHRPCRDEHRDYASIYSLHSRSESVLPPDGSRHTTTAPETPRQRQCRKNERGRPKLLLVGLVSPGSTLWVSRQGTDKE